MRIFTNSGHHNSDPGHIVIGEVRENDLVRKIRDEIKKLLPNAFYVPDELDLRNSIAWVKGYSPTKDDICIDIHANANSDSSARGTEVYHFNQYETARIFAECISIKLEIPNRGAKMDIQSGPGELGWCRQLPVGLVIETGYLTNFLDKAKLIQPTWQKRIAEGIVAAISRIQNPTPEPKWNALRNLLKSFLPDEIYKKIEGLLPK